MRGDEAYCLVPTFVRAYRVGGSWPIRRAMPLALLDMDVYNTTISC